MDFKLFSSDSVEFNEKIIDFEKDGKLFNIRHVDKKLLWVSTNILKVKYGFSTNPYKPESKDGTFVLKLDENLKNIVKTVDKFVLNSLETMYKGKILGSLMITENTLSGMFRPSIYEDTIKLSVAYDTCAVFCNEKQICNDFVFQDIQSDMYISTVIEPAFAWMFNQKIGIRWDCRQIKKEITVDPDQMFLVSDEKSSDEESTENISEKRKWNIISDSDSDENTKGEKDSFNKFKLTKTAKENTSTNQIAKTMKKWSIADSDSDSDSNFKIIPLKKEKNDEKQNSSNSKKWSIIDSD